jgi:anti-sigma regulatory factor (Ser/Thr protein kinase)
MTSLSDASQTTPPAPSEQLTLLLRGGATTPRRARIAVASWLESALGDAERSTIAFIVGELVTNSVVHANVDSDRTLTVEAARHGDRLLIAVTDPGSELEPHVMPHADGKHDHLGLFVVSELSSEWGFERDHVGTTRVWCKFPLDSTTE